MIYPRPRGASRILSVKPLALLILLASMGDGAPALVRSPGWPALAARLGVTAKGR